MNVIMIVIMMMIPASCTLILSSPYVRLKIQSRTSDVAAAAKDKNTLDHDVLDRHRTEAEIAIYIYCKIEVYINLTGMNL